jgi:hypothetical protein
MEIDSMYSCSPYFSLEIGNGVEIIIFTFKRSIRADVVTYGLDIIFGSLHMQQLHGFDQMRDDQGVIRERSAKFNTAIVSLYCPHHVSVFDFFH